MYRLIFSIINFFFIKLNPNYIEDKIIECFKKAIKIKPNFLDAWHNLGLFYYDLEDYQKAIECFKKIVEQDSEKIYDWYLLSLSYQELQEYNLELNCLKKIITLSQKRHNLSIKKIKKRIKELGEKFNLRNDQK